MSKAVPLAVSVTRVIEAPAEVVYDLLSDVTKMGDYSPVRVTESMRQDRPSSFPIRFLQRRAGVTDRAANLHTAITTTLDRVATVAERQSVPH